jgi:Zn-finger nucleic acid-binding protein
VYRDEYERCPRCSIELVDAGSARGCNQCQGMWVSEVVLREMANDMPIPPAPVQLRWIVDARDRLACPSCTQPMETVRLNTVPIDRCESHGVWFDRGELGAVLMLFASS